jgi:hypothetical protein
MEPDGLLPLYGLEQLKTAAVVYLHEGAHATAHVRRVVDGLLLPDRELRAQLPWWKVLQYGAHVGWIGGADHPDRTDWGPLKRLGRDVRVVVVADNDQQGKEAARAISRILKRPMEVVLFDQNFKSGFDLANPWPQVPAWWAGKRYIGPSLDDYSRPATWATDIMEPIGKGKKTIKVRRDFAAEWVMSENPPIFVHVKRPHRMLPPDMFNRVIAPYSDAANLASLLQRELSVHAEGVTFRPFRSLGGPRVTLAQGERLINTYRPPIIRPHEGDAGPFLGFMVHLIPDEEELRHVLRWCATLLARPEVRMRHALLLVSETQGVGKTTLTDAILKPLVGPWNVSSPSEHQVTDSQFNAWVAHKRLAVINEIYSGEKRKCYDRLKQIITDEAVDMNEKHMPVYTVPNFIHVVACSNSSKAMHLDDSDRRFMVPRVTEERNSKSYWDGFYSWIDHGGLSIIAAWAEGYVQRHGAIGTGERALMTAAKREIVDESMSEGQRIAARLAENALRRDKHTLLRIQAVREFVAARRGLGNSTAKLESAATLRKVMLAAGMKEPVKKPGDDKRIRTDRGWEYVVANFDIPAGATWADLKTHQEEPSSIADL